MTASSKIARGEVRQIRLAKPLPVLWPFFDVPLILRLTRYWPFSIGRNRHALSNLQSDYSPYFVLFSVPQKLSQLDASGSLIDLSVWTALFAPSSGALVAPPFPLVVCYRTLHSCRLDVVRLLPTLVLGGWPLSCAVGAPMFCAATFYVWPFCSTLSPAAITQVVGPVKARFVLVLVHLSAGSCSRLAARSNKHLLRGRHVTRANTCGRLSEIHLSKAGWFFFSLALASFVVRSRSPSH